MIDWFKRNLNFTAILAIIIGFIVVGFGSLQALEEFSVGSGAVLNKFLSNVFDTREIVFILLGFLVCMPIIGWTLHRRKRSIWWLLITLMPFGWFVVAFLGNQGKVINKLQLSLWTPRNPDIEENVAIRWRHLRLTLCCIGVVVIVVLMILAANYKLPITDSYYDVVENERGGGGGYALFEIKDYSKAPLWVKLGSEHGFILFIVGVFLVYGAIENLAIKAEHNGDL